MKIYPKLQSASALDNYLLLLTFSNGEEKIYDFAPNLQHPYYQTLQDINLFKRVKVHDGEILWATGQDFCPHTLYENS